MRLILTAFFLAAVAAVGGADSYHDLGHGPALASYHDLAKPASYHDL